MIKEGRRQFIPSEEGDQEPTQSELEASTDSKALRFLKRAGKAAALGVAMLNAESVQAQELSSPEKQKVENVHAQFRDEKQVQHLVEFIASSTPELKPFFLEAIVREKDSNKAGKFEESEYYVYLPGYDTVLTVSYNNNIDEPVHSVKEEEEQEKNFDKGLQEMTTGLFRGLIKYGLIELQKDSAGQVKIIPHYRHGQMGGKTQQ